MSQVFRLPPVIRPADDQGAYEAERVRAQHAKIMASMELKLHGRVNEEFRGAMDWRPPRARSDYDPHRW